MKLQSPTNKLKSPAHKQTLAQKHGAVKLKHGGKVDGCAKRGKTKGRVR